LPSLKERGWIISGGNRMTAEYEMCEHGRHIGAVCLECAEEEAKLTYVDPFDMIPESVDEVNSPKHYTVGGYETIDVIEAKLTPEEIIGGLKWQIMKYIMRANYKGHHDQDCEKAAWYANRLIKYLEKQKNAKSVDKKG
jgi:hypothetical protein